MHIFASFAAGLAAFGGFVAAMTPAAWSAVAAAFSAVGSISMLSIQRRNLLLSVKPELVLTDWSRGAQVINGKSYEQVTFRKVVNVGRGVALRVMILPPDRGSHPAYAMNAVFCSIIPAEKDASVDGDITLWWPNAEDGFGGKYIPIEILVWSWDSANRRHVTVHRVMVAESGKEAHWLGDNVAAGVVVTTRTSTSRSVWVLNLLVGLIRRWQRLSRPITKWLRGLWTID